AARALARELGIPAAGGDADVVIRDPEVDAVLVCSSSDAHADQVEAAARAGKHVFCEKPVDLDLARLDRVLGTVARAGVKLQVGFNRRFDPDFSELRRVVATGEIGTPEILRITSRDPAPPPAQYVAVSGGMFLDMTVHDLDMARFLMGDEVTELHAAAGVLVDPAIGAAGDVDTAVLSLRFSGGAVGAIDNSRRAAYGYDQRAEVHGSRGMACNRNHAAHGVTQATATGLLDPRPLDFFMTRYLASYEAEIRAFVAAIEGDTPPPVGGDDARAALVLGLAAKQSVATGRPVRLG
ncbi:MAG: inositol 2-dehydrogenase, partial [Deltaproteobacteria bacterium]|nr:inositol 2-dehydrogenase [Deltaproteobacteria bacterium]